MSQPKTVAIVQARMSSSRLPGKVLEPIGGRPAILLMCERLRRSRTIDALCVATSIDASDDPLAKTLTDAGIPVHRGSLDDVLDRFLGAARVHQADTVIRLTGDCPLIDPWLVDKVVEMRRSGAFDYVCNGDPPSYPDGLDVEVMTLAALERAAAEARLASEREHVTLYIRTSGLFRTANASGSVDLSSLRWTVDYPDDLAFVRALVDALAVDPVEADMFDLLRAQERHGLREPVHARNEGLAISLAADRSADPGTD